MNIILKELGIDPGSLFDVRKQKILDHPNFHKLILLHQSAEHRWFYFYQVLGQSGVDRDFIGTIKAIGAYFTMHLGLGPEYLFAVTDEELQQRIGETYPELDEDYLTSEFITQFSQAILKILTK